MKMVLGLTAVFLLLFSCCTVVIGNSGDLLWTSEGVSTATAVYDHVDPQESIISDGQGGAIVSWIEGTGFGIYVQKIDSEGNTKWTSGGVEVTEADDTYQPRRTRLTTDGAGGAIISWVTWTGTTYDIYAQRIDANGAIKWTTTGVAICTETNTQLYEEIASDGSGGAIITWEDWRSGNKDIYAQRVDSDGSVAWTANGIAVCNVALDQTQPQIISDGSGGAVMCWQDYRNGNSDIYAQGIDANGNAQWGDNGLAICTDTTVQEHDQLVLTTGGDVVLVWSDYRNGAARDLYAQKVSSVGSTLWTANGVAVCQADNQQGWSKIVSDSQGSVIIAWQDYRNITWDVYAQKVDINGNAVWTDDGIPVCTAVINQGTVALVHDGNGGAIIVWEDTRSNVSSNIYAQLINANGIAEWTADGIPLYTVTTEQDVPSIVTDGKGGGIVLWQDQRDTTNWDLYAQRVDGKSILYLPEGTTRLGTEGTSPCNFQEFVLIQNPTSASATVSVTYMRAGEDIVEGDDLTVGATSRETIWLNNVSGVDNNDVSVELSSDTTIFAERAMYWNGFAGGHDTIALPKPQTTWYLAEGSTRTGTEGVSPYGFQTYILLQNPGGVDASVTATFRKTSGDPVEETVTVEANSRETIWVNNASGMSDCDFATKITSNLPILVERAMYWNNWAGGTDTIAAANPHILWYLAEGTTRTGTEGVSPYNFQTYVLLFNPNSDSASVTATFMKTDGSDNVDYSVSVAGNTRETIWVNNVPEMGNCDFSIQVVSDRGIIVERAMYWDDFDGGTVTIGVNTLSKELYLPEGTTRIGTEGVSPYNFQTYVLLQNPNSSSAAVTATFMKTDGTEVEHPVTIAANSRETIWVNTVSGMNDCDFSTKIESDAGIIVERAMYWDNFIDGHASIAVKK